MASTLFADPLDMNANRRLSHQQPVTPTSAATFQSSSSTMFATPTSKDDYESPQRFPSREESECHQLTTDSSLKVDAVEEQQHSKSNLRDSAEPAQVQRETVSTTQQEQQQSASASATASASLPLSSNDLVLDARSLFGALCHFFDQKVMDYNYPLTAALGQTGGLSPEHAHHLIGCQQHEEHNTLSTMPAPLCCLFASQVPSMNFASYLHRLMHFSRSSLETFLLASIYVQRLKVIGFPITPRSVHRVFLSCLVLAIKQHDEFFLPRAYYAQCGGVTVENLNEMEMQVFILLGYSCYVSPKEFLTFYKDSLGL